MALAAGKVEDVEKVEAAHMCRARALQAHGACGERPDELTDAEHERGGRMWRLWDSTVGAWSRRKRRWGGRTGGFSVLATSLIGAEA